MRLSRVSPGARAAVALLFAALAFRAVAEGPETKPTAPPAAPADLRDARGRLAKAGSPAEYADMLDGFSSSLPPSDSLALLGQGLVSVGAEYRLPLVLKAGDLALLLGLFEEAASSYAEAASLLPPKPNADGNARYSPESASLLLRAARCDLGAGDFDKAIDISSKLSLGTKDPEISAASRLVGAWALALQGRLAEAGSAALSVAESTFPPARRREARFILWLCAASDRTSTADDKDKAAATLSSEFPGSPEALIASGAASAPPLPHWYLGGLLTTAASPTAASTASATVLATPTASALPATITDSAAAAPSARSKRLQLGYFSVEDNAQAMKDELGSKGFAATVETRTHSGPGGKAEEKRWIVVVDGGKDIAKTMQTLKDAGYEPYIVD
jgi:tetratricopeptide (TPR) repeat protein